MSGLEITNSSFIPDRPLLRAHKTLPRRRDNVVSLEHDLIPIGIQTTDHDFRRDSNGSSLGASAPALPLTPPSHPKEDSALPDDLVSRNSPVQHSDEIPRIGTPTPLLRPPTPDITPPRDCKTPKIGDGYQSLQPPSTSSRSQSFTTAREAISDEEKEAMSTKNTPEYPGRRKSSRLKHSLQMTMDSSSSELETPSNSASSSDRTRNRELLDPQMFGSFDGQWNHRREEEPATSSSGLKQNRSETRRKERARKPRGSTPLTTPGSNAGVSERTDSQERSLRERVQDSQNVDITASVERFGQDIGWVSGVDDPSNISDRVNSWRNSGVSTTSTVEAMVIDSQPQVKRTLRHTEKNPSLRSASSPVPNSNRNSMASDGGSQRRLVHKSGRISNQDRWSVTSDMSVPASTNTSPRRGKQQEQEIIPVVVIPERRSSLKSSNPSSRNHSMTRSRGSSRRPTTAPDSGSAHFDIPRRRKRTMSESLPSTGSSRDINNRRGRGFAPTIPARSSSLSAPTSRNNSRTTSLTSEALQQHRQATDRELTRPSEPEKLPEPETTPRQPLEKSPIPDSPARDTDLEPAGRPSAERTYRDSGTNTEDDIIALRRRSFLATPFTQPSIQSSSPGPIEINEAKAVSLFSHNNKSLFLVDQNIQPQSRAVQQLRTSPRSLGVNMKPQTPEALTQPAPANHDSPLRNPRPPPQPPAFKIIPPTPAEEIERELGNGPSADSEPQTPLGRRLGSVRRALSGRRRRLSSEPFQSPFSRSLWTRTSARNRKAGEDIDGRLHPFWRPRGFWDDISDSGSEDEDYFGDAEVGAGDRDSDYIVSNSLGIPQKRIIFSGPLSLVRRIQDSRPNRGHHTVRYGSRDGKRPQSPRHYYRGRRMHSIPGLGLQFRFMTFSDIQERIELSRQRRDEARREARREKLRKSIGEKVLVDSSASATISSHGDGRGEGRRIGEENANANAYMM